MHIIRLKILIDLLERGALLLSFSGPYKSRKDCAKLVSGRSQVHFLGVGFTPQLVTVENREIVIQGCTKFMYWKCY